MARVICTLPNASSSINGIAFVESKGQMISAEITDAQAAMFAAIPGYTLVATSPAKAAAAAPATPAADPAAPAK